MAHRSYAPAGTENFEIVPAGSHVAVCCLVCFVGWQESMFNGRKEVHPKMLFTWELVNEKMADGKNFTISAIYTDSLHSKANMRKMLECWRSRPFSKEELSGFDIIKVLGTPCIVSVMHLEKDKETKARVTAVSKLPKGTAKPEGTVAPLYYTVEPEDPDCCDSMMLPKWIREICHKQVSPPADKREQEAPPDSTSDDSDIPF